MDQDKIDYFIAKYRAADAEELLEVASRASSLAEEAQAVLRQVSSERGISLQQERQVASPLPSKPDRRAAREAEERSYSPARAEIIHIRKVWFIWSLPLAFLAGFVYVGAPESARGTFMGTLVALVGLLAFLWPLYCLYKLSRAVDPKRSVAWGMVAVQLFPIIGWPAAISLVLKAGRIRRAIEASASSGKAFASGDGAA